MFQEIYQKNINALKNVDIVLATKIIQASRGESFELSVVSEKHQLYNIVDTLQEEIIYKNIIDELQEKIQTFSPKSHEPFLYLFGIANAYILHNLLDNKRHQRIAVFEPELELLFVSFHLYDLSSDISIGRLKIFHQKSFHFAQAVHLFREHHAHHFTRSFDLSATADYYLQNFYDEIQETQALLLDALSYDLTSNTKSFDSTLNMLDFHLNNTGQMFKHLPIQSLINTSEEGGWSLIIASLPCQSQLQEIQKLRSHITLFACQSLLEALYLHNITPDIVTAVQYDDKQWKAIPTEVQETILLLLPSHANHIKLHTCHAKIIISCINSYNNRYFEYKSFGYIKEHLNASHMAYELSFLLKHHHTIVMDEALKEHDTQAYKHYCYLSSLYKVRMDSYYLLDKPLTNLSMTKNELPKLFEKILKDETPKKAFFLQSPDGKESVALRNRHNLKLSLLITQGYQLSQDIQKSLIEIQPWYDNFEGLSEEEMNRYYEDSELLRLVDKINRIKTEVEKNQIYQRFFHDFLQASMFLFHVEQASIQTKEVTSSEENREKILQWSLINYQWLIELHRNIPKSIELLLKYHNDNQVSA